MTNIQTLEILGKFTKKISWLVIEKIARLLSGLLVGLYVARYLGPEKYGILSYIISYISIFSEIARCGLESIVIRELINATKQTKIRILSTALYIKISAGMIATIAAISSIALSDFSQNEKICTIIISIGIIFQATEVFEYRLSSETNTKIISICKLWQIAISSISKLLAIYAEADLIWFAIISIIDQIVISAALIYSHKNTIRIEFLQHFKLKIAANLLKDSWPILITSALIITYMRIDQIMLKALLGNYDVGLYTAAMKIAELWYIIPMAFSSVIYPSIVAAHRKNNEEFNKKSQAAFDLMIWTSIPPIIIICLWPLEILHLLYGGDYENSRSTLVIGIWTVIPVALGVARANWMVAKNIQGISMTYIIIGTLSKITLNFMLIPHFGIVGAGIATLSTQVIITFIAPLLHKQSRISVIMFMKSLYLPGSLMRLIKGEWR